MDPADLEHLIDRELGRLTAPSAPATLLPRIMAAVQQTMRQPWYSRAWRTWPIGWQLASVGLLIAAIAGVAALLPTIQQMASSLPLVTEVRGNVAETTRDVELATTAIRVLWRALLAPIVPYAFGLVFLMCVACAVFGTALNHLVFGRALR